MRWIRNAVNCMLFAAAMGVCFADSSELTAVQTALSELVKNLSSDADLLKACTLGITPATPLPATDTVVRCDAADQPGGGLVCPPAGPVVSEPIRCSYEQELRTKARFSALLREFLSYDSDFKTVAQIVGTRTSAPEHFHSPNGSPLACASTWIKAKANYSLLFSYFQSKDFHGTVPLTNDPATIAVFEAQVQALSSKSLAFHFGPANACISRTHYGNTGCGLGGDNPPQKPPKPPAPRK
jgi:hypothetical protein